MVLRTRFHPHNDGTFTIQRHDDDIEPTIDHNRHLRDERQKTDGLKHIASIPAIIIEKWIQETGAPLMSMPAHEFAKFVRKKLRDPENHWLLTTDKL